MNIRVGARRKQESLPIPYTDSLAQRESAITFARKEPHVGEARRLVEGSALPPASPLQKTC